MSYPLSHREPPRIEEVYQGLVESMAEGLSLHEIIYDANRVAVDYRILFVNDAFTKNTGIPRESSVYRLASEVYGFPVPYLAEYARVAETGLPHRFETYFPPLDRFFQISVFCPGRDRFATVFSDITESCRHQEKIRSEKESLRVTLQSIGDAVIATDKEGAITLMNEVACLLTDWSLDQAKGRPLGSVFQLVGEGTLHPMEDPVARLMQMGSGGTLTGPALLQSKDGKRISIVSSISPIQDLDGSVMGVVLVFRDVTEENRRNEEIEYLSLHDPLTGLHNRRHLETEIARLVSLRILPVAVVIGDVNGLKITNDVFGHHHGDRLLLEVSGVLRSCVGPEDILVRWGGDEFLILLPGRGEKEARALHDRIRQRSVTMRVGDLPASISFGCAVWDDASRTLDDAIRTAEDEMYTTKLGENRTFRSSMLQAIQQKLYEKRVETDRHTVRLADICLRFATTMDLPDKERSDLEMLALLHDIGQIAIREGVLLKSTALDASEWSEMKRHTEFGYRIAQATPELSQIAEPILAHHEWWDGSGYPQGISGMNIPRLARILSIADAFDAMTHDRPYRDPIDRLHAADEIRRGAGKQFDPYLAEIFLEKIFRSLPESA